MRERQVREELEALLLEVLANAVRVGDDGGGHVPVGQNNTLGVAGGTRGVRNSDNAVRIDLLLVGTDPWRAEVLGLASPLLHLHLVEKEDAERGSPLAEDIALGLRNGVHCHDNAQRGAARGDAKEGNEMVGRGEDDRERAVVGAEHELGFANGHSHVLSGVRAESLVQRSRDEAIGMTSEVDDLPLLTVLAPDTDSPATTSSVLELVSPARKGWSNNLRRGLGVGGKVGVTKAAKSLKGKKGRAHCIAAPLNFGVAHVNRLGAPGRLLARLGTGSLKTAPEHGKVGVTLDGCKVRQT